MKLTSDGADVDLESAFVHAHELVARVGGREQRWPLEPTGDGGYRVLIDGAWHAFTVRRAGAEVWVQAGPDALRFTVTEEGAAQSTEGTVISPMPGKVIAVRVAPDDAVEAGATLVVVEAMKMELPLTAPRAGTVAEVLCAQGDRIEAGQPVVRLENPT